MRSRGYFGAEERQKQAKHPTWQIGIAIMVLIAYLGALFSSLWFSIGWLLWVLVALGMGSGIPMLLLLCISFTTWMHRKAQANDLEIAPDIAIEGCLQTCFAVLEWFLY
ncbi:MAG TPA: hypothetical protein VH599_16480 [Ktedonobacterales bacterium]|jgi:hypothetical protein